MSAASDKSLDSGWRIPNMRSARFFLLVGLFAAVSLLVLSHVLDSVELAVVDAFHNIQGALLDGVMIAITVSGDVTVMFPVGIVLTILRRTRRLGLTILISLVVISVLLVYLKPVYGRPLPPYQFVPHIALPDKFTLEQDIIGFTHVAYSFPSGHETRTVTFAFLVGFFLVRRYGWAGHLIWIYPIVVGVSRLYLFTHYPTDLFGSALLGVILAIIIARVVRFDKTPLMSDTKFVKPKH